MVEFSRVSVYGISKLAYHGRDQERDFLVNWNNYFVFFKELIDK